MRRASDSQSALLENADLPISLRTQNNGNLFSFLDIWITNRAPHCMTENLGNQNAGDQSNQGSDPEQGKRFKGTSPTVLIIIFGFVTAGLVAFGSILLNIHPKPLKLALCCYFTASISAGLAARLM